MPENEIMPIDNAPETAKEETAWEKFEQGQLSRRQALKKLGMTSAMAVFAMFSVDDLAHKVGKAMEQRAADNKVAEQIAQDFQRSGIALADSGAPPSTIGFLCKYKHNTYGGATTCGDCVAAGCKQYYGSGYAESECENTANDHC